VQQQAISLLVTEFYRHRKDLSFEEAIKKIRDNLICRKEIAVCVVYEDKVLGIATYIIHTYEQLKSQIYIEANYVGEKLSQIRLSSFEGLLHQKNIAQEGLPKAAGFAYSIVAQDFRGKGLGNILFKKRLDGLLHNQEVGIVFTIPRGPYVQSAISKSLTSFLLRAEESINGRKEDDNLVTITGVWVDSASISDFMNLPIDCLNFYSGSPATIKLASKYGFVPIGFFRNLSPVWVTTQRALHQLLNKRPI
jgi:hypothetical protein